MHSLMTNWGLFFAKDSEKFFLEIWGEHASAYGLTHFLHRPEAAFVHFRGVEVERLAVVKHHHLRDERNIG